MFTSVDPSPLSEREVECLNWAASGKTIAETAKIIGIADTTVTNYISRCVIKTNTNNKTSAVATAIRKGWI